MRKEFYKLYGVYIDDSWQIEVIKKVQIDDLAREPRGFVLSKLRLLAKKINSGEKLSVYDRYDLQGYTEYLNIKEVLIPISEYKGQYFDRKDLKRTTHEESPVTKYMKSLGVDKKELMQYYKEMDKIKNPSLYSGGNKYFELGLLRAHKDNRGHKFMKKMELRKLIREEINRLNEAKYIYNIRAGDDDGFDYDLNVKAIKKLVLKYMPTITKNELERFFAFEVEEIINDISILDFEENKISNINKSFESKVKKMSEYWLSINGDKAMRTIFNRD